MIYKVKINQEGFLFSILIFTFLKCHVIDFIDRFFDSSMKVDFLLFWDETLVEWDIASHLKNKECLYCVYIYLEDKMASISIISLTYHSFVINEAQFG